LSLLPSDLVEWAVSARNVRELGVSQLGVIDNSNKSINVAHSSAGMYHLFLPVLQCLTDYFSECLFAARVVYFLTVEGPCAALHLRIQCPASDSCESPRIEVRYCGVQGVLIPLSKDVSYLLSRV